MRAAWRASLFQSSAPSCLFAPDLSRATSDAVSMCLICRPFASGASSSPLAAARAYGILVRSVAVLDAALVISVPIIWNRLGRLRRLRLGRLIWFRRRRSPRWSHRPRGPCRWLHDFRSSSRRTDLASSLSFPLCTCYCGATKQQYCS